MREMVKLKILRSLSGRTQRQLAAEASITPAFLSMLESGKRRPSKEIKKRLSIALGIPENLLFDQEKENAE